ncbi:MAG: cobalamin biosynthesis protein, partial [Hyphomicrobiales bacterium]|nr:cobalamin biosynthesis protein [Hyphomicrobiales bacterium]
MFHPLVMPSYGAKRERVCAVLLAAFALLAAGPLKAAEQPRFASINLCTDQLLVTLADPAQILGLSPFARDPFRSWDKDKAAQFRLLSGEAEDVLALQPDAVVAGRFTKRATRELLKDKGLKVVEFEPARSLDDVRKQLRQMGALVKHSDRAEAEIAKLDAAIGDPDSLWRRAPHPVVWIGNGIGWLERRLNRDTWSRQRRKLAGVVTIVLLVAIALLIGALLTDLLHGHWVGFIVEALIASVLIAQRSLYQHVARVHRAFAEGGLPAAREAVAMIVGRDPERLDEAG